MKPKPQIYEQISLLLNPKCFMPLNGLRFKNYSPIDYLNAMRNNL